MADGETSSRYVRTTSGCARPRTRFAAGSPAKLVPKAHPNRVGALFGRATDRDRGIAFVSDQGSESSDRSESSVGNWRNDASRCSTAKMRQFPSRGGPTARWTVPWGSLEESACSPPVFAGFRCRRSSFAAGSRTPRSYPGSVRSCSAAEWPPWYPRSRFAGPSRVPRATGKARPVRPEGDACGPRSSPRGRRLRPRFGTRGYSRHGGGGPGDRSARGPRTSSSAGRSSRNSRNRSTRGSCSSRGEPTRCRRSPRTRRPMRRRKFVRASSPTRTRRPRPNARSDTAPNPTVPRKPRSIHRDRIPSSRCCTGASPIGPNSDSRRISTRSCSSRLRIPRVRRSRAAPRTAVPRRLPSCRRPRRRPGRDDRRPDVRRPIDRSCRCRRC